MILNCKKCNNKWDYLGANPYYATCSFCLNKVKVQEYNEAVGDETVLEKKDGDTIE